MALHRFAFRAMAAENELQVHAGDASAAEGAARAAIESARGATARTLAFFRERGLPV